MSLEFRLPNVYDAYSIDQVHKARPHNLEEALMEDKWIAEYSPLGGVGP